MVTYEWKRELPGQDLALSPTHIWGERGDGDPLRWILDGRTGTAGIVTPIVPFEEAVEAYRHIDEHPEESIELGVRFH